MTSFTWLYPDGDLDVCQLCGSPVSQGISDLSHLMKFARYRGQRQLHGECDGCWLMRFYKERQRKWH